MSLLKLTLNLFIEIYLENISSLYIEGSAGSTVEYVAISGHQL